MCGFAGFFTADGAGMSGANALVGQMALAIEHRGPDAGAVWSDAAAGIALGHRRLAIVDLSPAGAQPMVDQSGRYVIVYNGEMYNHVTLRAELDQSGLRPHWRGHSDTETLLAGFASWGIEATLARCIGMFAFALWDRELQTLTLGRDRLGEKPLYYGWQGEGSQATFLFGSELKALKAHPAFHAPIDRDALCLLLRLNYIPAPYSIYQGIAKLDAGCVATLSLRERTPRIVRYWSAAGVAVRGAAAPFDGSAAAATDQLETLLKSAVKQQMMADVPLGAFLSGGIDSSTVVALMQTQSSRPVKTFTIGFDEEGFNEAVHAKAVAAHLGTEHTELYLTPKDALDVIPTLPKLYCEPFSDSSQIPTFLVSKLARAQVTVSLSGDGGDELFCGYNRYVIAARMWKKLARVPVAGRRLASCGIRALSPASWDSMFRTVNGLLPAGWRHAHPGMKLHKAGAVLASENLGELYRGLVTNWADPAAVVIGGTEPPTALDSHEKLDGLDDIQRMMALDTLTYLPDDILAKVDRAGMGVSLEARMPFLDHRVAEFAWTLPQHMKLAEGQGKWILRQVLYRHVPRALIERPKMGFSLPVGAWLRGPLRDWAEALLDEKRLTREGYFHPGPIRRKWAEHLAGGRDWQQQLWAVLMFQAWLEQQ